MSHAWSSIRQLVVPVLVCFAITAISAADDPAPPDPVIHVYAEHGDTELTAHVFTHTPAFARNLASAMEKAALKTILMHRQINRE